MASAEEKRNKNMRESNEILSESIDLAAQLADQMAYLNKIAKDKGSSDKISVDLTKKALDIQRNLSSEFTNSKDIEKELAKNKKLQNELVRQQISLSKVIGDQGKQNVANYKAQESKLKDVEAAIASAREEEAAGLAGAEEKVAQLGQELFLERQLTSQMAENLTLEESQYAILEDTSKLLETNKEFLDDHLKRQENINKAQGMFGRSLEAGSKIMGKLGLENTFLGKTMSQLAEKTKEFAYEATDGGKKSLGAFGKLKVMAKSFGATLKSALGPMGLILGAIGAITKAYEKGKEAAIRLSEENVEFSRTLGVSQKTANGLLGDVRAIGGSMGIAGGQATAAAGAIYSSLDGAEKLSKNTLQTFMKLNVFAGMSAESIAGIQKMSKLTGEDAGKVADEMARTAQSSIKTEKVNVSLRQVMDGVTKVSNTMKLNFAGSAVGLTDAFIQSKKLGLELSKVEDVANSLLNIEDSIAAEMEAELLTGKDLNLEKAREAALNNDTKTLMSEIAGQFGSIEEYQKMNRVQQEAFAKSIGMSRDGLADMLVSSKENAAANTDMVSEQDKGLAAMQSSVKLSESLAAAEEARANQFAGIFALLLPIVELFKDMGPLILELITPIVQKLAPILKEIMEKLLPVIKQIFESLGPVIEKLMDLIAPIVDVFGEIVIMVAQNLSSALQMIIPFVIDILNAVKPILDIFIQMAKDFLPIIQDLFATLLPVIQDILKALVPIITDVLKVMQPILQQIAGIFMDLVKQLIPPLKTLFMALVPIIQTIFQALAPIMNVILDAIKEILPLILDLFSQLVPIAMEIINALMPLITEILNLIAPILKPILGIFIKLAEFLLPTIVNLIKTILPLLQPILQIFTGIAQIIGGILSGDFSKVAEGLKSIAEGLINLVIKAFELLLNLPIKAINAMLDYVPGLGADTIPNVKFPKVKLAEGGIVSKPTNALIGEAGPEAVVPLNSDKSMNVNTKALEAKIDRLIAVIEKGGVVMLDGQKVGQALVLGSYKQQ
jgi:phage-related protein